jgi:hypothetical protein
MSSDYSNEQKHLTVVKPQSKSCFTDYIKNHKLLFLIVVIIIIALIWFFCFRKGSKSGKSDSGSVEVTRVTGNTGTKTSF